MIPTNVRQQIQALAYLSAHLNSQAMGFRSVLGRDVYRYGNANLCMVGNEFTTPKTLTHEFLCKGKSSNLLIVMSLLNNGVFWRRI